MNISHTNRTIFVVERIREAITKYHYSIACSYSADVSTQQFRKKAPTRPTFKESNLRLILTTRAALAMPNFPMEIAVVNTMRFLQLTVKQASKSPTDRGKFLPPPAFFLGNKVLF
jgi:hypothetical protein